MIATTMTAAEMVGAGLWACGIMAGFVALVWIADRLLDRRVSQPERVRPRPVDPTLSIHDADDYFHGTGELRLRLHEYRRQLAAEEEAATTLERPAA